jgi:hypothetical protein
MDGALGVADCAIASPEPNSMAVVSTAVSGESLDFVMDTFIVILISLERPDSAFCPSTAALNLAGQDHFKLGGRRHL